MKFFTILTNWINEHPKQTVGAFLGFLTALLILLFGFWKTMFIALLACIGFVIGKILSGNT